MSPQESQYSLSDDLKIGFRKFSTGRPAQLGGVLDADVGMREKNAVWAW